jgi:hypothetical protein
MTAGRRPPHSRDANDASRCFFFPPLPHFAFISCTHQTTFFKKRKTYGKFLGGTDSEGGTSDSKKVVFGLKTSGKMDRKGEAKTTRKCKSTNNDGQMDT